VNILVMGAGAMGSAVGGFMALYGHEITLIGREKHIAAIREKGLDINGIWGHHHVVNLSAFSSLQEIGSRQFELIIISVKSYDTEDAALAVKPCVGADTLLCSYQNGLGNAEILAQHYGWERVLGARVIFGARINRPGEVEITVIAEPTAVGSYQKGAADEYARVVAQAMNESGVPTVYTDRIQTILWSKVAYNCALNPLSALLDVPYGRLAEEYHTRKIMEDVIHELYAVGNAMNIPLDPETSHGYSEKFYGKLLPPTAAHYASMREDRHNMRRTEIDALNGCIAKFGAEHGISCPANGLLTALIHAREKDAGQRY
jgi:2-dehydropantoate 2-reductase